MRRAITLTTILLLTFASLVASGAGISPTLPTVCIGGTVALTGTPSGGTWVSSNPAIASVGFSTGAVNGLAAGTAAITYTDLTAATATVVVTVNPVPTAISGASALCAGAAPTTFTDPTSGGTWSTSNAAIATINSATGVASALSSGITTISYILSTGCAATKSLTVNASPSAIAGTPTVCPGTTSTLSNGVPGGLWTITGASATIGSSSGVVNGVATGTAVVTYSLSNGCSTTLGVTVNSNPFAISGPGSFCEGTPGTLTDATGGGTWSSSNTSVAIVNSSGAVFGITSGSANISYIISATGCYATRTITVNPVPVITGAGGLCVGAATTLSSSLTGGAWSSSNVAVATVNSAGAVNGISSGAAFISYTMGTGCYNQATINVSALPAVTGPSSVCAGSGITFSSMTTGGTWTTGNPAVVTIDPATGMGSAIAAGGTYISYTTAGGCTRSQLLTVNAQPADVDVTGGGHYCMGGGSITIGLATSESACVSYTLYHGSTSMGTIAGTGTTLSFGSYNMSGTYSVVATNSCTGCSLTLSDTVVATSDSAPVSFLVSGGGHYCSGGSGLPVTLDGTEIGISYQLYNGSTSVGAPIAGTGSNISFGLQTAVGTYSIKATNTFTGCTDTMDSNATIVVDALPDAITGTAIMCVGATTTLGSGPVGGTWSSANPAIAMITSYGMACVVTGVSAGTVTIDYTNSNGCAAYAVVTVSPLPSVISGIPIICQGNTSSLSNAVTGGIWTSTAPTVATVGSTSGVVSGIAAGTAIVSYSLGTGCATATLVSVNPLPSAGTITGATNICVGSTSALSSTQAGGVWSSSNPAVVSVSTTGVITGVSYGGTSIIYTRTTSCGVASTSVPVICSTPPGIITGFSTVCQGATITLTNGTPGGTWTSSTPSVATAEASTGHVTGISAGTTTITYTVPTGCYVTFVVTAMPTPVSITGPSGVCLGQTASLSSPTPGGTWSSSNTAVAGIGVSSGVATGLTVGSALITYRLASGCISSVLFNVNPMPEPITGGGPLCVNSSLELDDASPDGFWTSSNLSLAIVLTVGGVDGVVTALAPGTVTFTYTLPTGCSATTSVTINPLPTVAASYTSAGCGGRFQLSATGTADVYAWEPAAGLSCTTCSNPIATVDSATTITLTGTITATGCSASDNITIDVNRVSGHITFGSALPADLSTKVWLIQYSPTDSTLLAIDSTVTCTDGTSAYFEFAGKPVGDYIVKAKLISSVPGTTGYVPTYSSAAAYWSSAATIAHTTHTNVANIDMLYGTVPAGSGFISGHIGSGAGKGTTSTAPAAGITVLLRNALGNVITYTTTDTNGDYSFTDLANGSYTVYPDDFGYLTVPSHSVTITTAASEITGIDFMQLTMSKIIRPYNFTAVSNLYAKTAGFVLYPNPAADFVFLKWDAQPVGAIEVTITDITGYHVLSQVANITSASGETRISLPRLASGMYMVNIHSAQGSDVYPMIIKQ